MQILNCKIWGIQVNKIMEDFNPRVEKNIIRPAGRFCGYGNKNGGKNGEI